MAIIGQVYNLCTFTSLFKRAKPWNGDGRVGVQGYEKILIVLYKYAVRACTKSLLGLRLKFSVFNETIPIEKLYQYLVFPWWKSFDIGNTQKFTFLKLQYRYKQILNYIKANFKLSYTMFYNIMYKKMKMFKKP